MAVNATSSTRLGCGRDIDQVWARLPDPPDDHERTCPDCLKARASLTRLGELTSEQRAADAADPDLQPDPQVLARIMTVARAEVRRARQLPLDEPNPAQRVPELTISEQAVVAAARRAGDAVPGVQVRRCRVTLMTDIGTADLASGDTTTSTKFGPRESTGSAAAQPARVAIALQISVSASTAIPPISQALRDAVIRAVRRDVGMITDRVDIDVRDIHDA